MREGDVVIAQLQQADQKRKNRPAVILRTLPSYNDLLLCGISSRLQPCISDFDEMISPSDTDFSSSGLLTTSIVRLGFLSVLTKRSVVGSIGSIAPERHRRLLRNLGDYLTANLEG
jgi:mRNA interferase MazF